MRGLIPALIVVVLGGANAGAADDTPLRQWTPREVNACFGDFSGTKLVEGVTWMRLGRDGCSMSIVLDAVHHLHIREWAEADRGDCRRVLRKCDEVLAAANLPVMVQIGGGDAWSYVGEGISPSPLTCSHIPCRFYCGSGYCAHGRGHLGTDGSWWYDGDFVRGQMEGRGRYENDFYVYTGGFKGNEFDGKGQIACLTGPYYLGEFADGRLVGQLLSAGRSVETRIKTGDLVDWIGPCEE
jgi:hypothetical protein